MCLRMFWTYFLEKQRGIGTESIGTSGTSGILKGLRSSSLSVAQSSSLQLHIHCLTKDPALTMTTKLSKNEQSKRSEPTNSQKDNQAWCVSGAWDLIPVAEGLDRGIDGIR